MTDTFNVGLVVPSESIEWLDDTFVLRWRFDDTELEIHHRLFFDPPGVPVFPFPPGPFNSLTLPLSVSKTNNDPAWNKPSPDARWSHHILMGPNGLVEPHSVIVNTRFNDDGFPYIIVWDWINSILYGPLVLPDAVKQIEGPIRVGNDLFFVAVDAVTFKPQLYRTPTDLVGGAVAVGDPGTAIPTDRSIEYMMASNQFVSVWETPAGGSGPVILAHVWDRGSSGAPVTTANVTGGFINYAGARDKAPGQKIASADSFFIRARTPFETSTITLTEVTSASLFGAWGSFLFPDDQCYFTIENDGQTVLVSYTGPLPIDFLWQRRTWRTGAVIDAEANFSDGLPAGWNAVIFPFET